MPDTLPKVTLREAQMSAEIKRLLKVIGRMNADIRDMNAAHQTIFVRCACGRVREQNIICPTNQEGGHCEAGS